jgi:hypothetical protein
MNSCHHAGLSLQTAKWSPHRLDDAVQTKRPPRRVSAETSDGCSSTCFGTAGSNVRPRQASLGATRPSCAPARDRGGQDRQDACDRPRAQRQAPSRRSRNCPRGGGYHRAWVRWSATSDELADLVAVIHGRPARTVSDLAVKFDALAWSLLADGAVVDHEAERQVRAFGRVLRRVSVTER